MNRLRALVLCSLALAVLAGCSTKSNLVPLEYLAVGQAEGLCARPVAVGTFTDRRPAADIGRDRNIALYPAGITVEQWVARALETELAARGCEVSREADSPFTPDQALRGEILKLSIVRDGFDYTTELELVLTLVRDGQTALRKTYHGRWERTFVTPSDTRFRDLLRQALQDVLRDVAHDLRPLLGQ
ncbi:LPS assembly lipoprotein LptE [Desulfocurvus vexinensis]|uniref:LPS assembly lipoprotein LptE n=1 Tax=Desulfocurvus vexinensis TaxID=399548 RepID=UPI0004B8D5AA|nr:LPS assembly lipoprotein LptE [Desulfocurvus vexinensis]